jgi:hypothetical protein
LEIFNYAPEFIKDSLKDQELIFNQTQKYKIPSYKDPEDFAVSAKFTCSSYCLDFVTFED